MAAEILSLAQQSRPVRPSADDVDPHDTEAFLDGERRRLSPARGMALGIGLSVPVWALIAAIAYFAL